MGSRPNALPQLRKRVHDVVMTRHQLPVAPQPVGTFDNMQGKTARAADGTPLGHTIDLRKPDYMEPGEYKQHLYMILGRAQRLSWTLFYNFPMKTTVCAGAIVGGMAH